MEFGPQNSLGSRQIEAWIIPLTVGMIQSSSLTVHDTQYVIKPFLECLVRFAYRGLKLHIKIQIDLKFVCFDLHFKIQSKGTERWFD